MIQITGTHFNYYMVCKRKLWLFANGISMEHTSDLVYEGKMIHESAYPQRSERYEELEIDGIKIDYYDVRNKIVHEIKKSDKMDVAHEWQVKYYIYVLEKQGIEGVTGILEYPLLRKKEVVVLSDIFKVLNKKEIQEKHFDKKMNRCLLNTSGKKIFVQAMEERFNETIQHRTLHRHVSYKHLIKLECYKLAKHLLDMEEYKPFKMYW